MIAEELIALKEGISIVREPKTDARDKGQLGVPFLELSFFVDLQGNELPSLLNTLFSCVTVSKLRLQVAQSEEAPSPIRTKSARLGRPCKACTKQACAVFRSHEFPVICS